MASKAARFSDDVLAEFGKRKSLHIRAGIGPHRFIGIWVVVVDERVFVRSWSIKPQGWYRAFLRESWHSSGRGFRNPSPRGEDAG